MAIPEIRLANMEDKEVVFQYAKEFFLASPYSSSHVFSDRRVKEVIDWYLSLPVNEGCIFLLVEDISVIGMLIAVASKSYFTEGLFASEQVWWVDPSHRKGRKSLLLKEAFEEWAHWIGATHSCMSSVPELTELDGLYTKLGYQKVEHAFMKEVTPCQ